MENDRIIEDLPQHDNFIPLSDTSCLMSDDIILVIKHPKLKGYATAACVCSFDLKRGRAIPDSPYSVTIIHELMRVIHPKVLVNLRGESILEFYAKLYVQAMALMMERQLCS